MLNIIEVGKGCAKGLLILINLLCILVALCTFGFAVVDMKILRQYGEEQAGACYTGDLIVIVATLFLVAVGTMGCVGAAKDSVKLLHLYVGFTLFIVILEMLIAIYVSLERYGLQFRFTEWIRNDFYQNVTVLDMEEHLLTWDKLHTNYQCCGLNGPEDYIALEKRIPITCCSNAYGARSENARKLMYNSCVETATYYKSGCEEVILDMIACVDDFLIGVGVISFWFEACGILLAMWVSRQLSNSVQVYKNTVKY